MFPKFLSRGVMVVMLASVQPVWSAGDDVPAIEGLADTVDLLSHDELRSLLSDPGAARGFLRRVRAYTKVEQLAAEQGLLADSEVLRKLISARRGVLIDTLKEQERTANPPPDGAIEALARDYYDAYKEKFTTPRKVKIAQITVFTDDCSPSETTEKIEAIETRLKQGESFESIARELSEAKNASIGGRINKWIIERQGTKLPPFLQHAFALQRPGDVSPLFEFGNGFHFLKLLDETPATVPGFDAVRDTFESQIEGEYLARQSAKFMESLYPPNNAGLDTRELERLVRERLSR